MKLLLDQNLSFRLVKNLARQFPEIAQVRLLGLENSTDKQIWEYARHHHYTIVTFNADFYDFSLVWGQPPKIIWLRTFTQDTDSITNLLLEKAETIRLFVEKSDLACLEIVK